jgi:DNA primase
MKMENLSFPEAVRFLAEKHGINIPQFSEPKGDDSKRERLYSINHMAAEFFKKQLWSPTGEKGRLYLQERGITSETMELFQLGYAGETWDSLIKHITRQGIQLEIALEAGLVNKSDNNRYYDLFRNRIIFPICDVSGRFIGFGGRWIDEVEGKSPKYINSPESLIYKKSNSLYGLNLARDSVRKEGHSLVVEGYFDLITLVQNGVSNVVGSSGTALTQEQLRLLRRYTHNVVLVFDADAAGRMALVKKAVPILESDIWVKVLSLPPGEDPDSFMRKNCRETFMAKKDEALPYMQYLINIILEEKGYSSLEQKLACLDNLLPLLRKVTNQVEQMAYLSFLADKFKIPTTALVAELKKTATTLQGAKRNEKDIISGMIKPDKQVYAEQELVRLALKDEDLLFRIHQAIPLQDFKDPDMREIILTLLKGFQEGYRKQGLWNNAMEALPLDRQRSLLSQFLIDDKECDDKEKALVDCLNIIKRNVSSKTDAMVLENTYREALLTEQYDEYDKLQRKYIEQFR